MREKSDSLTERSELLVDEVRRGDAAPPHPHEADQDREVVDGEARESNAIRRPRRARALADAVERRGHATAEADGPRATAGRLRRARHAAPSATASRACTSAMSRRGVD